MRRENIHHFTIWAWLIKQCHEWSAAVIPFNRQEIKHWYNLYESTSSKLVQKLEKELGPELAEMYWDQSAIIGEIFQFLAKATPEQADNMILLLKAYKDGKLKLEYGKADLN